MRTKTTLLCAAALAAGVVGSMAQSNVYSVNIVGYANVPVATAAASFLANPFNLDNTNSAANVLNLPPLNDNLYTGNGYLNQFFLNTWNGHGYTSVWFENDDTLDNDGASGATNGWAGPPAYDGSVQGAIPTLAPGLGFYIILSGSSTTNTFVGSVAPLSPTTNSLTIFTAAANAVASVLPVSGPITNAAFQFPIPPLNDNLYTGNAYLNQFFLNTWNGHGYSSVWFENDDTLDNDGAGGATDGWAGPPAFDGSVEGQIPNISIGEGFFIVLSGSTTTWSQTNIVP